MVGGDDCDSAVVDVLPDGVEVGGRVAQGWCAYVFRAFPFVDFAVGVTLVPHECLRVDVGACGDFGGEEVEVVGASFGMDGEEGLLGFAGVVKGGGGEHVDD